MPHLIDQDASSARYDSITNMDSILDMFAETLVSNVEVYRVDGADSLCAVSDTGTVFSALADQAVQSQSPCLAPSETLPENVAAVIAIPVVCGPTCTSVIVLALRNSSSFGVFEVWKPVGRYAELSLVDGYYSTLERFHNVSSFVRFERGMGLPGQAWERGHSVIHNDLPNHPGFLRAAGASAEALASAVGIPVTGEDFIATVVLINSGDIPIARTMQSWIIDGDTLVLGASSAHSACGAQESVMGSGQSADDASIRKCLDSREAAWHPSESNGPSLAIPTFVGGKPTGVLVLRF